jgi:hypothetical protein
MLLAYLIYFKELSFDFEFAFELTPNAERIFVTCAL